MSEVKAKAFKYNKLLYCESLLMRLLTLDLISVILLGWLRSSWENEKEQEKEKEKKNVQSKF